MADDSTTLREPLADRPRVPDPRTDLIRFDYTDERLHTEIIFNEAVARVLDDGEEFADVARKFSLDEAELREAYTKDYRVLEHNVITAALAWREADETNASQRCEELIAACDKYVEAKEK